MNGPKRIRRIDSTVNRTNVYGLMGGQAPRIGIPTSTRSYYEKRAPMCFCIPRPGVEGGAAIRYMRDRGLLSKNPTCSGGVSRRQPGVCGRGS